MRVALPLLLIAAPLAGQPASTTQLAEPVAAHGEPFSQVAGVAELPDGRIVVVDSRERTVQIIDLGRGTQHAISREGTGPREYRAPFGAVRWRGDTVLVYDAGNRRYLRVAPSGALGEDLTIPAIFISRGGLAPPRGVDDEGRLYWAGDVLTLDAQLGPKRAQTQNVRRWSTRSDRLDTVATVADHAAAMHEHRFHPFAQRDAFVVAPDGRVGVLSAAEYRLRWFRDGRAVAEGPPLDFTPIPVRAAERDAFRRERARTPAGRVGFRSPAGVPDPSPAALRSARDAYPDEMFPAVKPPFVEHGAQLSPRGDTWVTLSGAAGEERSMIEVISPTGTTRGKLLLPPQRGLVALGNHGIYLVRTDQDGLQWLEVHAYPAGLGPTVTRRAR